MRPVLSFLRPSQPRRYQAHTPRLHPVISNALQIPLTIAGWASITTAVFLFSTVIGLIVLGVVLMILEHQIADGDA